MKNDFYHRDDGITVIILKRNDGKNLETLISTSDFEKVHNSYSGTWSACWTTSTNTFRVVGRVYIGNRKCRTIYLHRFIFDEPNGLEIDHKNHDTLDNTRENLRIVTHSQNQQNKKSARKDNQSTGFRNVYCDKRSNRYFVGTSLNGRFKTYGFFDTKEEACKRAIEMRKEIMTHAKENE